MTLIPIQVECYAGAKADETPRRFVWEGRLIEVGEVLDLWHQVQNLPEWPRANYFKVRGQDHHDYLLKHDLESDEWYLGKVWQVSEPVSRMEILIDWVAKFGLV